MNDISIIVDEVIEITDANFDEEILQYKKNFVLVDFWAEWCNPCKTMAQILTDFANTHKNKANNSEIIETKIKIAKVNLEKAINTGTKYHIKSIPTLLLINNGKVLASNVGSIDLNNLKKWLLEEISKNLSLN